MLPPWPHVIRQSDCLVTHTDASVAKAALHSSNSSERKGILSLSCWPRARVTRSAWDRIGRLEPMEKTLLNVSPIFIFDIINLSWYNRHDRHLSSSSHYYAVHMSIPNNSKTDRSRDFRCQGEICRALDVRLFIAMNFTAVEY